MFNFLWDEHFTSRRGSETTLTVTKTSVPFLEDPEGGICICYKISDRCKTRTIPVPPTFSSGSRYSPIKEVFLSRLPRGLGQMTLNEGMDWTKRWIDGLSPGKPPKLVPYSGLLCDWTSQPLIHQSFHRWGGETGVSRGLGWRMISLSDGRYCSLRNTGKGCWIMKPVGENPFTKIFTRTFEKVIFM